MPEVHSVYATVRQPRDDNDLGQVTIGFYVLVADVLTMTDSTGAAVRNRSGEKYTRKIEPGEDARAIASRLTRQIYDKRHGDAGADFNRAIDYPRWGVA